MDYMEGVACSRGGHDLKKDITSFNGLERSLDEKLPSWIVPVGRVVRELEYDGVPSRNLRWGFRVVYRDGFTVSKATPKNVEGKLVWERHGTKFAIPDFVVLDKVRHGRYCGMVDAAKRGVKTVNPFRELMCDSGWYVEVLGDYYHSGEYVCGLTRDEHEREMREAYASAGSRVLILWEWEVGEGWAESGLPKVLQFVEEAGRALELPEWDVKGGVECFSVAAIDGWRSLFDANYYRELAGERRFGARETIFGLMRQQDYPRISEAAAMLDYRKFVEWCGHGTNKRTRFGTECCAYWVQSQAHARVCGQSSDYELWHDDKLLRQVIDWQLSNEDGSHHSVRFLHALRHVRRFRYVSNLHPSFIARLLRTHAGDIAGKVVLDPCAGWGGRLLAVHGLGGIYVGVDANGPLVGELQGMARAISAAAEIAHGDSASEGVIESVMAGRIADCVITSPPYWGKEWYSGDAEQSSRYGSHAEWMEEFMLPMIRQCLGVLRDGGRMILIVDKSFDCGGILKLDGVGGTDEFVTIEHGGFPSRERVVVIAKGGCVADCGVRCAECGLYFRKLGWHLRKAHGMTREEYLGRHDGAAIVSAAFSEGVRRKLSGRKRGEYRLSRPRADRWAGKVSGEDFVECSLCGYRGRNIKRHLAKEHGLKAGDYDGAYRCAANDAALRAGAARAWLRRRGID